MHKKRSKSLLRRQKKIYSQRSPVAKAYRAGVMPIDHCRLLKAIINALGDGVNEGEIHLEDVLKSTGYYRASALKMLCHMQNFGVLETEPRYHATWVRIVRNNREDENIKLGGVNDHVN